ncbi:ATP-binding SpoIIE family protein phosphatase [Paraburkholderia sp.]|uniref:ATP-binding SpoIIE family protein phosphatase n=1 Tax=Paraburkholderia sp. TaxID=1926495 RepID=UPI00239B9F6E|nr:ATP-binding SpoIIE family protein phosphatase [Paraburkholderia sp.]MDE1181719.1 ATP-binding protein/SpoIIE family protein phosphatase [Paraburkholderia sp.]
MEAVLSQAMPAQQRFEIGDPSQVSYARRGIGEIAAHLGFSDTLTGRIAIIVTECGTNLLKHAKHGELLVRPLTDSVGPQQGASDRFGIEILSIDNGPGIADIRACFVDGYTTAGSPGNGMGAIQRLASELDIWSEPGQGTVLRVVVWSDAAATPGADSTPARASGSVEYGAINLALHGELLSGDAWTCTQGNDGFTVMIVDGLGHGPLANVAAVAATSTLPPFGHATLAEIVNAAHEALRPTRGAAIGVARLPPLPQQSSDDEAVAPFSGRIAQDFGVVRFCGVGNIAASVWTPESHRHLVSHAGIVGHTIRKTQEFDVPWSAGALLVMHSDGLATRWDLGRYPGLTLRHPSLIAAVLYRDYSRGRDDLTVFVAREVLP